MHSIDADGSPRSQVLERLRLFHGQGVWHASCEHALWIEHTGHSQHQTKGCSQSIVITTTRASPPHLSCAPRSPSPPCQAFALGALKRMVDGNTVYELSMSENDDEVDVHHTGKLSCNARGNAFVMCAPPIPPRLPRSF